MSLNSLNDVLGRLDIQIQYEEQPLQQVLKFWTQVVGEKTNAHTRPLSIQRNVLRVATSSAAWAQNLTFGRQRLLLKLNALLSSTLTDIHFSAALWQSPQNNINQQVKFLLHDHPSYVGQINLPPELPSNTNNPVKAFEHWANTIQRLTHGLPLCPACQCPTPPGELERWAICCVCAAKQSCQ